MHFPGEEVFVQRLLQWMNQVERQSMQLLPFLTPSQQEIVGSVVGKAYQMHACGFYEHAERKRMVLCSHWYDETIDFAISHLVASYESKYISLTHSDVLGALMQLGMNRSQFGDIVLQETKIGIVVATPVAPYVMMNLTKIHQLSVQFILDSEPLPWNQTYHSLKIVVSSLRLDTVVGALMHGSRNQAKETIQGGFVKVNHSNIESIDKVCNNKDIISIRGHGRYEIVSLDAMTKKGNYVVVIKQYV